MASLIRNFPENAPAVDPSATVLVPPMQELSVPLTLPDLQVPEPGPSSSTELLETCLAAELEDARRIQECLLPQTFPSILGFEFAGFCKSARLVGGDFYDVVTLANGSALLVVADVMGKGVPAALFAGKLRTLVRTIAQWTQNPADMLARINAVICEELSRVDMFITAQIAVVDPAQATLRLGNAGHCPLLLGDANGVVQAISARGLPLGIAEDAVFSDVTVPLSAGCFALLYTDGLTDPRNFAGTDFGQERLENWLSLAAKAGVASASGLKQALLESLSALDSKSAVHDDQTFLILAPVSGEALRAPAPAQTSLAA